MRCTHPLRPGIALLLTAILLPLLPAPPAHAQATHQAAAAEYLDIPYTKHVLDNGLTLIVHEDRKAPIVAVNVWYHVGSKNEKPGKTGFAHLFEHLMFNGSEHNDDDYFQVLERIGATDLNGTTNNDRTNYFQNVPATAVDVALWMESDRMGHLLGAIDQAKLDEQRGVVQNEKRQGENQPYGQVWNVLARETFPSEHPYSWSVIGSMEDLDAASLEDVHEWFEGYYGPNNAVVVLAGDIDAATARQKVEAHFGSFEPNPPIERPQAWVPRLEGEKRHVMQDRVPQARIYKVWNVPEWGTADADYLDLASDVLASGKTSRLYRRLVYDDQIATDVSAFVFLRELAGQFMIQATAKPGQDLGEVERAIDEELHRFLAEGPTAEELQRVQTAARASFVRGIERIGGFGGKSDVLAMSEVFGGSPEAYKTRRLRADAATPSDVHRAAREWLRDGVFVLEVHPFPDLVASDVDVDRSAVPVAGEAPAPEFPAVQRETLENGLEIVLAERSTVPLVDFTLMVDAGFAADHQGVPGTASLALNMLDEGTTSRNALEISEAMAGLGARLSTGSDLDASYVSLSTLTEQLGPALDLYADVILNPSFPAEDFERLRQQQLARIQQEKSDPISMGLRVFPVLLYGEEHPYGTPFSGSGTEATVRSLTREQMAAFHQQWFKPNNAKLVVVGDISMAELRPQVERLFRGWRAGDVPEKNVGEVTSPAGGIYLMDKPGAQQSIILVGHAFPPKANDSEFAIQGMNRILGGSFTSRVNMNLREDKHWSYGAQTLLLDARGPRPFVTFAPVQTDKTAESMAELMKELRGIAGDRPATAEELEKAKLGQTLSLPGRWETIGSVAGSIVEAVKYGLPDGYWQHYADNVRGVQLVDVNQAARELIDDEGLIWLVVGDRAETEEAIRALGLGPIRIIDPDGRLQGGSRPTAGP